MVGTFLAGLAQRRLLGLRGEDGRVVVPPTGFDQRGRYAITDWVEVSQVGTLAGFTWIDAPQATHPRAHPFAFALVRLDGADTSLFSVLDASSPQDLTLGMRVRAAWSDEPRGHITDLRGFVVGDHEAASVHIPSRSSPVPLPSPGFSFPIAAHYDVSAGRALSIHLRGLVEGRFIGLRCARCARVYVPPLGACCICALPVEEEVELSCEGTVTTLCLVNLEVRGQEQMERPFACANVLLDGADTPFLVRIGEVKASDVRQGMRVRARFRPAHERSPSLDAVSCFVPTHEPDIELSVIERARREQHRA